MAATQKTMFIQQFTTSTNYKINNWQTAINLLSVLETKAAELECKEIWEAL